MRAAQPHAAVWLDIPRTTHLRATITVDDDIHIMFGAPNDEMNMIIERRALTRLIEIVSELLAVPEAGTNRPKVEPQEIRKPASCAASQRRASPRSTQS